MGGKGRIPKPANRKQRNRPRKVNATMEADPAVQPKLPRRAGGWHTDTKKWWNEVWASPMAEHWLDADVPALVRIAGLVDRLARLGPDDDALALKLSAELRLQQQPFGLTPGDRLRLHWTTRPTAEPEPEPEPKAKRTDPRLQLGRD